MLHRVSLAGLARNQRGSSLNAFPLRFRRDYRPSFVYFGSNPGKTRDGVLQGLKFIAPRATGGQIRSDESGNHDEPDHAGIGKGIEAAHFEEEALYRDRGAHGEYPT
jgi:hypothetical protein